MTPDEAVVVRQLLGLVVERVHGPGVDDIVKRAEALLLPPDPLEAVRVGDAPPRDPRRTLMDPICNTEHRGSYVCTRPPGHPGRHIASAIDRVVAVWPQVVSSRG